MFQHAFLVALCTFLFINNSLIQFTNAQTDGPFIERVTGCDDTETTTLNCPRPTHLTIQGRNFTTGAPNENPFWFLRMFVNLPAPLNTCEYEGEANSTHVFCQITDRGYAAYPTNQLLSVSVHNQRLNVTSNVFPGFTMLYEPMPTVTGVTGCKSSDSMTALECDLVNDRITIVGSGFNALVTENMLFSLGSESIWLRLRVSTFILSISDTQIVLSFSANHLLLSEAAQRGERQRFTLLKAGLVGWTSTPVYIQFTNLPRPNITSIDVERRSPGCDLVVTSGSPRFRDCLAGLSRITIRGQFIYNYAKFYVGGISSSQSIQYLEYAEIAMPVYQFTEGIFYDISVVTPIGTTSWEPVIEFNTEPIIAEIKPCVTPPGYMDTPWIRCMPGETLYMSVMNVKNNLLPRVFMTLFNNRRITVECTDAMMIDTSRLSCTMPPLPSVPQAASSQVIMNVEWASGERTTNITRSNVWEPAGSPRITSMTGCYSNSDDPLYLNQCLSSGGANITLTGIRLEQPYQNWTLAIGATEIRLTMMITVDGQTLVGTIPPIYTLQIISTNVKYQVSIKSGTNALGQYRSNYMFLTFVDTVTYDTPSVTSTSNATTIALATIFSLIGAILLGVVVVLIVRKSRNSEHGSSELMGSDPLNHVELSDITHM